MRVCVLYGGSDKESYRLRKLAEQLARGIQEQDCAPTVEVFNIYNEMGRKVSYYDYYAFGSEAVGTWGGKIPGIVGEFLKNCGTVSGKRFFCFTDKKGLRRNLTLLTLMRSLEKEGAFITNSEILESESMAYAVGRRLKLAKN